VLHLDAQICPVKEGRTREFLLNFYLNDAANSCTVSLVYNGTQQEINTSQIYASWDGVSTLFIQFLAFSVSTVFICITNATEGSPLPNSQFLIIFQQPPSSFFTFQISSGSSSFQTIQPNTQYIYCTTATTSAWVESEPSSVITISPTPTSSTAPFSLDFGVQFQNFYQSPSSPSSCQYIEQIAYFGCNTILFVFQSTTVEYYFQITNLYKDVYTLRFKNNIVAASGCTAGTITVNFIIPTGSKYSLSQNQISIDKGETGDISVTHIP
jgi:hypothetical protein